MDSKTDKAHEQLLRDGYVQAMGMIKGSVMIASHRCIQMYVEYLEIKLNQREQNVTGVIVDNNKLMQHLHSLYLNISDIAEHDGPIKVQASSGEMTFDNLTAWHNWIREFYPDCIQDLDSGENGV